MTVEGCFAKAGFQMKESKSQTTTTVTETDLRNDITLACQKLDIDVQVSFNDCLAIEEEITDEACALLTKQEDVQSEEEEEVNEPMKIKSFSEAFAALSDLQQLAAERNCLEFLQNLVVVEESITRNNIQNSIQKSLRDYFQAVLPHT